MTAEEARKLIPNKEIDINLIYTEIRRLARNGYRSMKLYSWEVDEKTIQLLLSNGFRVESHGIYPYYTVSW